jgi:hypothetical protein
MYTADLTAVKEILEQIAAADVVKIDNQLYAFVEKPELDPALAKVEDHVVVFQTEYHVFNWWEITNDCTKLNNREWKIGHNVLSFYSVTPVD